MALPRFSPAFQILSPSRDPVTSPFFSFSSPPSSPKLKGRALSLGSRRPRTWRRAALAVGPTEEVLIPAAEEERVEYDWREEWYPLYLSEEVPRDAPLGLNVFDKKLVLYRDGNGSFCCFEDRCPHRLAKLSEGQLIDGRLECLYHGWQFGDDGKCVKIPQLPEGAKIPRSACAKTYKVWDSQGVVWVWMSNETPPSSEKLPYFEYYSRPDFQAISTIHELPYDHSIVLENFMDPAHVPISHDRSDFYSKREDAQPLVFEITERSPRGFAGKWSKSRKPAFTNFLRFEAPCALQNNHEYVDKARKKQYVSSLFLCRPTGQGKSMVIIRFGTTLKSPVMKFLPTWFFHQNICKVFEQDMGFLSSQNEILMKEKIPVGKLYLNLRSCDTWVLEYRKWKDRVGHGMPHYFGNGSISLPKEPAVVEHSPAGLAAGISASMPAKGGSWETYVPNPINRYFRHIVHCKECGSSVKAFGFWRNVLVCLAIVAVSSAIVASRTQWKVLFLVSATLFLAGQYVCYYALNLVTTNFIRNHRRL